MKNVDTYNCCGCTACSSICKQDAISMEPDALGFLYPHIDEEKCIDCGLCDKICSFNDNYDISQNFASPIAYAVRHKDLNEVMCSRSGAAFVALSDAVLQRGGVVYGAGYDVNLRVIHKRAKSKDERDEFRGSKYVQSDLGNTFKRVEEDLKSGLLVLFSGTPCQTAGLSSFLGKKNSKNLLLVDIICHGVPSPLIWKDYMAYQEKKHKDKIISFDFRDKKEHGWKAHYESFVFGSGKKVYDNLFKFLFFQNLFLRNSCSKCHFANLRRPSDITIGDYWGWEKSVPDFNKDDKGVNLLFCNTEKGKNWFDIITPQISYISVKVEDSLQPNLIHPSKPHIKRDGIEIEYSNRGFDYLVKQYGNISLKYKIKRIINIIGKKLLRL